MLVIFAPRLYFLFIGNNNDVEPLYDEQTEKGIIEDN